ncbi:hypothetical protein PHYPSEUDO_014642 [Phytophthora pseudosyringae]|uniref:Transmembrane protein n=1 Tax=Phytophthora pseudosyringae TaxID=221518 RepID=A0A8T1W045_9STRA|nr:hypothetical protein PHYPSEUDO_014642 [Phytophthora pseudosyringae]
MAVPVDKESHPQGPHATGTQFKPVTRTNRWVELMNKVRRQCLDQWFGMQVAHYGGKYSIERMLALEEYSRETSLARVICMSIAPALVVVVVVLCQEIVPLQRPAEGWENNYGFWIRVGFAGFAVGYAGASQVGFWLDVPPLTSRQILACSTCSGASFVAVGMAAGEIWVFPIPFCMLTISTLWFVLFVGFLRVVMGARAFRHLRSQKEQLRRLKKIGSLQGFMCVGYPAYQVLFTRANQTRYELPVLLLLQVLRLVMKIFFATAAAHKEDMIPAQVVFTVDFFDALYLATFMQSFSTTSLIVVLVIDFVQTGVELLELHQRTQRILARCREATAVTSAIAVGNDTLLQAIRSLCSSGDVFKKQSRTGLRLHSCIAYNYSATVNTLLDDVRKLLSVVESSTVQQRPSVMASIGGQQVKAGWRTQNRAGVVPQPFDVSVPNGPQREDLPDETIATHRKSVKAAASSFGILEEALEVLFTSECLVLTEYVELIIPMLHGAFIWVMIQLPSAQYHTEMAGVTQQNVHTIVSRIFLYASLEFASFIALAIISRRNCGINVLYQLAFVLETQMPFVVSTLMVWILTTLTYRVVHFGADFSFQFQWIT